MDHLFGAVMQLFDTPKKWVLSIGDNGYPFGS